MSQMNRRGARGLDRFALGEALDALPEGIAAFDAAGGLLFWNSRYVEIYAFPPGFLRVGLPFPDVVRRVAHSGRVPDAVGREEEWAAERIRNQAMPDSDFEHRLDDGRWIRVEERRTAHGLTVGVRLDITALKRREASFRLLFETNPVPILVRDRDSAAVLAVNDAALRLFGYGRSTFLSLRAGDLWAGGRAPPPADTLPWRGIRADGSFIDLLPYSAEAVHAGRAAVVTALVDMTEVQRGRDDLRQTRAFLDGVIATIPSLVFVKDVGEGGRYVLFNRGGSLMADADPARVIGRTNADLFDAGTAGFLDARDHEVMQTGKGCEYEFTAPGRDGRPRRIHTRKVPVSGAPGEPPRFLLGVVEDVTERREMERRLDRAARFDDLTGLLNRAALVDLLRLCLDERRSGAPGVALLLIDLDDFRVFNDALGHAIGDALLAAVGARVAAEMRGAAGVARLAADEFVVVRRGDVAPAEAERVAQGLLDGFARPFAVAGQELLIGASVGVALSGDDLDPGSLLRHAELALARAKATRRGTVQLFEGAMDEAARRRRALEQDLRGALDRGEFELHYQAQVDLATEAVVGFEALVRWRHPGRGLVDPGSFIAVAEETGLIVPLGNWVLRRACADAASWPAPVRVAVNLSPVQFMAPGLGEAVRSALAGSGLPPDRLELEITESVRLLDNDSNRAVLHGFREVGIAVALDDFGTGFSSLSYLRSFPFDKLKIDRSFVEGLGRDAGCLPIVRAAAQLARDFGMGTVAEGIETPLQLLCLRQLGCGVGQGYLFGRPLPLREAVVGLPSPRRAAALA